jgi:hypothetical protein
MNKQITVFQLIVVVLTVFLFPSLIWINSVEKFKDKVKINESNIEVLKKDLIELSKGNQLNFDKVLVKLHSIELSVKDKKYRE